MTIYSAAGYMIKRLASYLNDEQVDYLYQLCRRWGSVVVIHYANQTSRIAGRLLRALSLESVELEDIQKHSNPETFACIILTAIWTIHCATMFYPQKDEECEDDIRKLKLLVHGFPDLEALNPEVLEIWPWEGDPFEDGRWGRGTRIKMLKEMYK